MKTLGLGLASMRPLQTATMDDCAWCGGHVPPLATADDVGLFDSNGEPVCEACACAHEPPLVDVVALYRRQAAQGRAGVIRQDGHLPVLVIDGETGCWAVEAHLWWFQRQPGGAGQRLN